MRFPFKFEIWRRREKARKYTKYKNYLISKQLISVMKKLKLQKISYYSN